MSFFNKIIPLAIEDYRKTGVLPSLTIAQACLESNFGRSGLATRANNLFGIKGEWNGRYVEMETTEYVRGKPIRVIARFRAYPSWSESIADHSMLFTRLTRYRGVLKAKNYREACRAVAKAGYATDPNYAEKLIALIEKYKLYEIDEQAKGEEEMKPAKVILGDKTITGLYDDKKGITYVPVRDVVQFFGGAVKWMGGDENKVEVRKM